ncbi:hypothetical protein [Leptospira sp. GIMC2001]|uniref:hypothetical protein n=1 Tax=Leptospira sp. GIMC2001 TaxID=1513297 RepID=UPI00234A2A0C|nr:hypothetical protein [Leptospira sp. GIMC2001]WCL51209.1 hypothetical protein O4O04_10490 [Leptospira sp. GIMC2001]
MLNKIIKHYHQGTLKSGIWNFILNYSGYRFIKKKIKNLIRIQEINFYVPKAKCEFELPKINGICVVYGSAPSAHIPVGYKDSWKIITANSSQWITDNLGLKKPDISVVCSTSFLHGNSAYEIAYNEGATKALIGKNTGYLIIAEDKICSDYRRKIRNKKILGSINKHQFSFDMIDFLAYAYRYKLSAEVLNDKYFYKVSLSMGFFCGILAYYLGASPIIMTGFSFTNQYHGYPDDYANKKGGKGEKGRGELTGDLRAVEIIKKLNLPFFAADKVFAEESGLNLWK